MGKMRNAHKILARRPEGKGPLGRPSCIWEDNSRMVCEDIGWEGMDWIYLTQDRYQWPALVNMVMKI
jgi:hypothetical protein